MNNYQQKLFLLCTLLLGCVLTSLGVEYFGREAEPISLPPPQFTKEQVAENVQDKNKGKQSLQEQGSKLKHGLENDELPKEVAIHKSLSGNEQKNFLDKATQGERKVNYKSKTGKYNDQKINNGDEAMQGERRTVLNINKATVQELVSLPGIGAVIAKRIVEYREAKPFASVDELLEVKGIGEKKLAKLRELVTVE